MLVNVSYNNPEVASKVDAEVGKAFTLIERIKRKGVGSSRLAITQASIAIHNLLILDNNLNTCSIELRPDGIIVRFRSILETYALVVPYYKLHLYKGEADHYTIYRDHYFIKVKVDHPKMHLFFRKILDEKAAHWSSQKPPL